jgi:hypothetical protein
MATPPFDTRWELNVTGNSICQSAFCIKDVFLAWRAYAHSKVNRYLPYDKYDLRPSGEPEKYLIWDMRIAK